MRRLLAAALLCCLPAAARANDYVDTRLNFTLTDENLLVKPGETNPSVPGIHIGQPSTLGLMFFDNYDTRYTGYENLTHLVLYKKITGSQFEAEGALVLRFLEFSDITLQSIDDGSYIKLTYYPDKTRTDQSNFALVAFPMSADRMRLGYSYRISWGGSPIFFKFNPDLPTGAQQSGNTTPAPGARVQWSTDRYQVWAGFKTSLLLNNNPEINEQEAVYSFLGGATVDLIKDRLRWDINGGYFYRGTNQNMYPTEVLGPGGHYTDYRVDTAGVSTQLSIFHGVYPSGSLDYALYKNDPTTATRYFSRPIYKPGFNWMIQSEFTYVATSLQDADNTSSTTWQNAFAGDINFRAQAGHFRLKADLVYRSLEFILLNQPSLVPFQAFPKDAQVSADKFVSVGMDYFFERIGLTIGPTIGVDFPATFAPPAGSNVAALCGNTMGSLCSSSTIVVRDEGDYSILPQGFTAVPVFAAKLVVREDFLDYFAVLLDLYYTHDGNQTVLTKVADMNSIDYGAEIREFNKPDQLGFNLTLQARF